jgi:hypothetical protein
VQRGAEGSTIKTHAQDDPFQATLTAAGLDTAILDRITTRQGAAPTTQAIGDVADPGASTQSARADHLHGEPAFAGTGAAATIARSDHTHVGGTFTPFDPKTTVYVTDDFLVIPSAGQQYVGDLGWRYNGAFSGPTPVLNHPGVIQMDTGTTSGTFASLAANPNGGIMRVDEATWDCLFIARLGQSDVNTTFRCGLAGSANALPSNGVYFEKLDADTNWFACTRASNVSTRTDMGQATNTNWRRLRVRRISGTQYGFTIDNGTEVVLTSGYPTAGTALGPMIQIVNSAAVTKYYQIDFFSMTVGVTR